MKPMLEPQKDLKGATPESLAKALLHKRRAGERVAGDQVRCNRQRPTRRATVSPICASVSKSRMLCLPANSWA